MLIKKRKLLNSNVLKTKIKRVCRFGEHLHLQAIGTFLRTDAAERRTVANI